MQRREFITLLGGAAAAWPLAARAQQRPMPVIGLLGALSPEADVYRVAFRKGLSETGYVEGQNVVIEYRWDSSYDRLPELAADLVRRRVVVIATIGGINAALAAKAATTTIPIVFGIGADPIQTGLVASLNRPGGNVTGLTSMSTEVVAKRFGLLHDLMPVAARFAVLVNPKDPNAESVISDVRVAASTVGRQIEVFFASTNREVETAFVNLVQKRTDALFVSPSVFFTGRRVQFATLASHHRVPAIYSRREYTEAGGLMSYGTNFTDQYRLVGVYTGRILKGEKPADLPVQQATRVELIINMKTAKALGLTFPLTLLGRADEVIE